MAGTSLQIRMSNYWTLYDIMSNSSVRPTASSCCQHLGFTSPQSMRGDQTENTYSSCCFPSARDWCLTTEDQQKKEHFSSVPLAMCMHANLAKCSAILLDFWQTLAVFSCFLSCCGRGAGRNKNPSASCYHWMSGHFWLRCHNSPKYRAVEININSKTISSGISNPLQWLPPHCVVGLWRCFQILHDARSLLHVCCKQYLRILFSLFEKQSDSFEHNTDCNSNHAMKVSTVPGAFVSCSAQSCVFLRQGLLAVLLVQVLTSFTPYALEPSWHCYSTVGSTNCAKLQHCWISDPLECSCCVFLCFYACIIGVLSLVCVGGFLLSSADSTWNHLEWQVPTRSNLWTSSACEGLEKTQQRWEKKQ